MMWHKILFLTIAITVSFFSPSYSEIIDRVVAKINTDIITLSEVKERALALSLEKKITREKGANSKTISDKKILMTMVEEILQIQHAKKIGIKIPDEYVYSAIDDIKKRNALTESALNAMLKQEHLTLDDYTQKIREQMMISRVVNFEIKSRILIEEDEVKQYYEKNYTEFLIAPSINIRHIFFPITEGSTEEEVKKIKHKAENVLKKIKNGADFIDMVKQYSQGPNAASGGETGFFTRGAMVKEIEDSSFSLKDGDVSDLIQTPFGLHIIKAIEKRDERPKRFEDVKKIIEEKLFESKSRKKYLEWIQDLKEKSYVDILLNG